MAIVSRISTQAAIMHILSCIVAVVTSLHVEQGPITCDAGAASSGTGARVTCHFGTDVRRNQRHFALVMYPLHIQSSFSGVDVLRCHWTRAESPECRVKTGFVFDYNISDVITVTVPDVTAEAACLYACELVPANGRIKRTCSLNITESGMPESLKHTARIRPTEGGENGLLESLMQLTQTDFTILKKNNHGHDMLVLQAITLTALLILIVMIIFIFCRLFRIEKETGPETCNIDKSSVCFCLHSQPSGEKNGYKYSAPSGDTETTCQSSSSGDSIQRQKA